MHLQSLKRQVFEWFVGNLEKLCAFDLNAATQTTLAAHLKLKLLLPAFLLRATALKNTIDLVVVDAVKFQEQAGLVHQEAIL